MVKIFKLELIEDALGEDNEDISDVETDKLINEIEVKVNNKAGGTVNLFIYQGK